MKHLFILISFMGLLTFSSLSAQNNNESAQTSNQTEQVVASPDSDAATTSSTGENSNFFGRLIDAVVGFIVGMLILLTPIAMIFHMLYVNMETRKLKKPVAVDYFIAQRTKRGLPEEMTEEEVERGFQLIDEAYNQLTVIETDEEGNEVHKPKKMRELLRVKKKVNEVGKLMPTNEELLERYNDYRDFLYDYLRRSFFASWKLIIIASIAMALISYLTWESEAVIRSIFLTIFWFSPVMIYYLSGSMPQYMIDKKNARGGGGGWFSNMLIGIGVATLFSGQTVVTKTTWSDGSTTTDTDNSSHIIALLLGLMILAFIAFTIIFWAVINYLRNYVFYF